MITETTSLHSFCRTHDLAKTTVRRWLLEQGFDTSNGLCPEAVAAASDFFLSKSEEDQEVKNPKTDLLTIHQGNHCQTLHIASMDGLTIDLGQFRNSQSLVVEDPVAAAQKFLAAADLIQNALANDIQDRQERLQATKEAQAAVAARAQELALEQRLYRLQTAQIDQATTEESKALANALGALQSLGKPQSAAAAAAAAAQDNTTAG